jgi:hypothetical protein
MNSAASHCASRKREKSGAVRLQVVSGSFHWLQPLSQLCDPQVTHNLVSRFLLDCFQFRYTIIHTPPTHCLLSFLKCRHVRWEVCSDAITYVGSALLSEVASLKSLSDIEYSGTTFSSIILMAEVVLAN